jgi:hypothetical protein
MTWNGSGDFQRLHNFSADASAGIKILASRQDAEWANFEAGLENCVTRDGQNAAAADLPMGGHNHTNVGAATSVTHYLRADQFIRSFPIYCGFGGTAEAMSASAQFALTSLTAGVQVLLSCPSVNTTTSVTLGLTGAGTGTVLRADGRGPARGQVKGLHRYVYDGANWILTDPSPIRGKYVVRKTADQSVALATPGTPIVSFSRINFDTAVINEDSAWVSASTSAQDFTVPGGIRAIDIQVHTRLNHTDNGTAQLTMTLQNDTDVIFGGGIAQGVTFTFSASALPTTHLNFSNVSVTPDSTIININMGANVSASCDGGSFTWLTITPRD